MSMQQEYANQRAVASALKLAAAWHGGADAEEEERETQRAQLKFDEAVIAYAAFIQANEDDQGN